MSYTVIGFMSVDIEAVTILAEFPRPPRFLIFLLGVELTSMVTASISTDIKPIATCASEFTN